jgi:alpha-beta hydrolase superfamily lysophospholipase
MGARMRRLIEFPCEGETLFGTLDEAPGTTGLLIVSGGNEIRVGAHRGMALLAGRLAGAGHPVFRFDRRGIGDSTGENHGFESSADDIAAAAAAFRREPASPVSSRSAIATRPPRSPSSTLAQGSTRWCSPIPG